MIRAVLRLAAWCLLAGAAVAVWIGRASFAIAGALLRAARALYRRGTRPTRRERRRMATDQIATATDPARFAPMMR